MTKRNDEPWNAFESSVQFVKEIMGGNITDDEANDFLEACDKSNKLQSKFEEYISSQRKK
jgi:hypothetical protein